jgi:hypothetical protein
LKGCSNAHLLIPNVLNASRAHFHLSYEQNFTRAKHSIKNFRIAGTGFQKVAIVYVARRRSPIALPQGAPLQQYPHCPMGEGTA